MWFAYYYQVEANLSLSSAAAAAKMQETPSEEKRNGVLQETKKLSSPAVSKMQLSLREAGKYNTGFPQSRTHASRSG